MNLRRSVAGLAAAVVLASATTALAAPTSTTEPPRSTGEATERKQSIDSRLKTLKQQVAEASAEETEVLGALDQIAARRRTLDQRLAALDVEIEEVEADLAEATAQLDLVEADLRRASAKLADTDAGLQTAKREMIDRAVEAYIRNPTIEAASAALRSENYHEFAATDAFLETRVRAQRETVRQFRSLRRKLESERAELSVARIEVTETREEVEGHREDLVDARNEQSSLRRRVAADEAKEEKLLTELRGKLKTFEAQIAALKRESDSIAAFLRARQSGKPIAPGSGVLGRPVSGPITSLFGPRVHPILGTVRNHTGVDFGASSGTSIKAAAAGEVLYVGTRGGYGETVIIDHGGTLATLYAHQSRIAIRVGATVSRGQTIGYVGSTGFSTGPHLHFEVRVNGNPVDPMRYL